MKHVFLITLLCVFSICAGAQVTIGSGIEPKSGVLLDMKENANGAVAGNITANSTKGMMMPRVLLETVDDLSDIPDATSNSITDATAKDAEELNYTGLTVYNIGNSTNPDADADVLSPGVYIWDGTRWVATVVAATLKTFLKAHGTGNIGLLDLNLELIGNGALINLGGAKLINFTVTDFDLNNEYAVDATTNAHLYTAKQAGIYNVYAQLKSSGSLVDAGILGIGIIKRNAGTNEYELIAQESFLNVTVGLSEVNTVLKPITDILGILGNIVNGMVPLSDPIPDLGNLIQLEDVNVTPPYRKAQTLVQLNKDDKIAIILITSVLSLNALGATDGGSTDTFFTIHQVH